MANANTSTGNADEWTDVSASNASTTTNQATHEGGGRAAASNAAKTTTYGATLSFGFKYDMMLGGDSARFAATTAKHHLLQLSKVVPITIKPRGNTEADILEGATNIAAKLHTIPKEFKEYITVVYDKIVRNRGACKCLMDIQTDIQTGDALKAWEAYLVKANVTMGVVTEKEETKEEMKKAVWFSGVQPRHCNKLVVKRNIEKLLSEKGKDMPIEIIECFHTLPVDVTENGIVSQQRISAKVLAVKTNKENIAVLSGNVSRMINHDKANIFNDPADLEGIANPHPVVHAIPFRAHNRFQHLLLSQHKSFMDTHKVQFFLHENADKVIPATRLADYITDYANLTDTDNTLRRIIMSLTNSEGNQVAEAMYSTQRSDFIISCEQANSKVIADFCDLHALEYKNMWDKFDPNYESDMARDMKALVEQIDVEEKGFYMAPGKMVQAANIKPSAWKRKPRIVTDSTAAPLAIRTELKRTEEALSTSMDTVVQKLLSAHQDQIGIIQENHRAAMDLMTTKFEEMNSHAQSQGEMINELMQRNDKDQMQMTEGFEKLDKNVESNERALEGIFHDVVKMQETTTKDRHTVVKALQQNMDTTTKAFKIIGDELNIISNTVEAMSDQADQMEESLEETAKQVNSIFENHATQRQGVRKRRERSRSVSSVRSNSSTNIRLRKRQQRGDQIDDVMETVQAEFDAISSCGESNSSDSSDSADDDQRMGDLPEGDEGDDTMLSDDDLGASLDEDAPLPRAMAQSGPLVSESPQDEDSCRD